MANNYSYRKNIKDRKSKRNAFVLFLLTIGILVALFFYGIPALIRFAVFFADLNKSSTSVDTQDIIAPSTPRTDAFPDFTNSRHMEIQGYSEAGSIVTMYFNSKNEETVANNEGEFRFNIVLGDGLNTFSFVSKDSSGNESPRSKTQTVVFDNTPPKLEIVSPANGSSFYGTDNRNMEIIGITDPEIKIYANERLTTSDEEGNFKIRVLLSEGENEVNVKAIDNARNITETILKVAFSQ